VVSDQQNGGCKDEVDDAGSFREPEHYSRPRCRPSRDDPRVGRGGRRRPWLGLPAAAAVMMMTVAMAVVAAVAVAAVPAVGVRLASTSSGACAHACMHRSSSDVELHTCMHVDAKL
jgi:hypothetical protein